MGSAHLTWLRYKNQARVTPAVMLPGTGGSLTLGPNCGVLYRWPMVLIPVLRDGKQ